jgi:tyrosyl-tRNA synthetase
MTRANFVEELQWRGMLHDMIPGTEEQLNKEMTVGYIGFDPTADSLGVGNLVQVMTLLHFQRAGHKPIALVGGATGMVGDPSGKSEERNLLNEDILQHNLACQRAQLERFLDFDCGENSAEIVNNYDWFKEMGFLEFIRDVGKHITVNYMLAKDSVKNRMDTGMSFTEFSYQLVQGYDFHHLHKHHNCKLQMGGSDQWGNITTGTELIRRLGGTGGEAFALTTPLIKKADGTKFGKSEKGNIWLDPNRTSPYEFYQFWINASDDDVKNYIKIFSIRGREEIEALITQHDEAPHLRLLQQTLAEEITIRVHSEAAYQSALKASKILFGKATSDVLKELSEEEFLMTFKGVPQAEVPRASLEEGIDVADLFSSVSGFLKSKGEARRAIKQNALKVNKEGAKDGDSITADALLKETYLLLQRGKKSYFIVKAV